MKYNQFIQNTSVGLRFTHNISAMPLMISEAGINLLPIGNALQNYLKKDVATGENTRLLEIASGYGNHVMYFSKLFPHIQWQPSELQDRKVDSIRYYKDADPREKYENVAEPLKIDVCDPVDCWGLKHDTYDFMFNSKMVHILPWKGTVSLFANAGKILKPQGRLFMYGSFSVDGELESTRNQEYDASLRLNHPGCGIRDLWDLKAEASKSEIILEEVMDLSRETAKDRKLLVWKKE